MNEVQSISIEQAKAALRLARAYHAGAMLAVRHKPDDPAVQRRAQDAVHQGRGAWKDYVQAATASLTLLADGAAPAAFADVPSAFRED